MSNSTVAGFRLSVQQDRTWSQQAGNATLWTTCELAIDGVLDVKKLQAAIRGMVARHEILRTAYHRQTGVKVPFQVILESHDFAWKSLDVTGVAEAAKCSELARNLQELQSHLNLEKGPALHVLLAKTGTNAHVLVLAVPSLSADAQTLRTLVAE